MALPSGYIELEYIQSGGTQYIRTGVLPQQNLHLAMDVMALSTTTAAFFGGRTGAGNSSIVFWQLDANTIRADYGNVNEQYTFSSMSSRFTIDMNNNVVTFGNESITFNAQTFSSPYEITLLTNNTGGTIDDRMLSARIFAMQIFLNTELVRDYIPCKNASGEVGLYDQVGAQFYGNAGTGTFEAGPEVVPEEGIVSLQEAQLIISDSATITLNLVVVEPTSSAPVNISVNSVSGTVNGTATAWTLSGALWTTTVPLSELGQYLCVFDVATSDSKTVEMRLPLYYGVLSLITDRTQADVDELLSILQTPFADWTTEQAQLYYSGMSKGAYNASDLNRVGAAMVYIAERISSMGYAVEGIAPKLYWMDTDVVTQGDMSSYLSNIAALQAVLPLPDETPIAPSDMAGLTFTEANNIEQILAIINTMLTNISLAYMYAGELYGGEI